ncbi:MAG: TolC family protein [Desulfobacula sp.]|nr:TolC family protein [Desulfobacula sp.]
MKLVKLVIVIFFITFIPMSAYSATTIIKVGLILDGTRFNSAELITDLKKEIHALLPGKVQFSDQLILSSSWQFQKAKENYAFLEKHPDVNLIIAFGVLSSGAVIENKRFIKPTMAVGIVEPDIQGLKIQSNNQSNTHNLTYVLFNQSLKRDLKVFKEVYPYKKVGIIADENIISAVVKNTDPIQRLVEQGNATFTIIGLKDGIKDALKRIHEFDAAFLGHMGRFEGEPKKELIENLSKKKIPSFGASLSDIDAGVLASISPDESLVKIIRRTALNIEALISGANFSSLPLNLDYEEKLTINIQAAKKINYSPKFSILARAHVVNELSDSNMKSLTLDEVVDETLKKNIELKISQDEIVLAGEDLKLAKSGYYPSVSANATQTIIDEDRAESSFGKQAQRTASGNLKLEQVLFSDNLNSNVHVNKKVLSARQQSHLALHLDTIYNAVEAYFSVLKTKTGAKIQKKDLELTKKHLAIARQRQLAGYSGASDVYRWQSSIATATSGLFEAMNAYKLSKISLNKLMNRPLNDDIAVKDESLTGDLFRNYSNVSEYKYIDNPATFEKFVDFLVSQALYHSPEIKELEANMAVMERQYLAYKRECYLPTAALTGDATHIFNREGKGSDVSGVSVEDDQWTVAISLSWPLFTGGSTRINQIRTQKQMNQLKKQTDNLILNLEANVRSAALNVVNKYINLESSKESNLYAHKSLELVQQSYASGKVSITELINAQSDALNARLGALTSSYEYLLSVFNIERTTGSYRLFSTEQEKLDYMNSLKSYMDLKQE